MIMGGDGKKVASLIMAKFKPSDTEAMKKSNEDAFKDRAKNTEAPEPDGDQGLISASEDILSAIDSKDANALMSALKSFCQMAEDSESDDSDESDSDEADKT